jgi:methylase of polypeptide subunit release factors
VTQASPKLQPVLKLFLLNEPVANHDLPQDIVELMPILCQLGLANDVDGLSSLREFRVFPIRGYWLFVSRGRGRSFDVYFGSDSIELLNRLTPPLNGSVLDLCSGTGIQAIHCSRFSPSVTAVELNRVAHAVGVINCFLNAGEPIEFLQGSLYEPLGGRKFEYIVANPPFMTIPEGAPYPLCGDGGPDGFAITRQILQGLPEHLESYGRCQIMGGCLSDGRSPAILGEVTDIANSRKLDILITITAHRGLAVGTTQFRGMARTVATFSNSCESEAEQILTRFLDQSGATHSARYFLSAQIGQGDVTVIDLSETSSEAIACKNDLALSPALSRQEAAM